MSVRFTRWAPICASGGTGRRGWLKPTSHSEFKSREAHQIALLVEWQTRQAQTLNQSRFESGAAHQMWMSQWVAAARGNAVTAVHHGPYVAVLREKVART